MAKKSDEARLDESDKAWLSYKERMAKTAKKSDKAWLSDKEKASFKEVIDLLSRQMAVEEELIKLYEDTKDTVSSKEVRYLLHMMMLDSMKHKDICQTAIDVLQGNELLTPEKQEIKEGLERHVQIEADAIDTANKILKNVWVKETEGVKELIKEMKDDEIKHHKMLKKLLGKRFFRQGELGWKSNQTLGWQEEKRAWARKYRDKKT